MQQQALMRLPGAVQGPAGQVQAGRHRCHGQCEEERRIGAHPSGREGALSQAREGLRVGRDSKGERAGGTQPRSTGACAGLSLHLGGESRPRVAHRCTQAALRACFCIAL